MSRGRLAKHSPATSALNDLSVIDLLQLRVAAPMILFDLWRSSRSKPDTRQERLYPNTIHAWVEFENEIRAFTVPDIEKCRKVDDVLYRSLHAGMDLLVYSTKTANGPLSSITCLKRFKRLVC